MMRRIIHFHFIFIFLILMNVCVGSINAWGESAGSSDQMPMKPVSCQKVIVELQNQLHAANQFSELLRNENDELNIIIKRAAFTMQELENTIRRIRREVN